jgi:hypothetical protein
MGWFDAADRQAKTNDYRVPNRYMSERDRQLQREIDDTAGLDVGIEDGTESEDAAGGRSFRSRIRSQTESVLSPTGLGIALALVVSGLVLIGGALPLGTIGNLIGIFLGAFVYGLGAKTRRYLELTVAGAVAGGGWALLSNLIVTLLGAGVPFLAIGALGGATAAALGHYFGRDLRDGLTREI